jgi:hypothetical protein
MTHARPEIELLLGCARRSVDEAQAFRIKELLREPLDWTYLLRMAHRHKLVPLLYRHLQSIHAAGVPAEHLAYLRDGFISNTARNHSLTIELLRILKTFAAHEIPALAYKGPALAVQAYGQLALRSFSDLDILIRVRDFEQARELLIDACAYQPDLTLSAAQETALRSSECDEVFSNCETETTVELHWAVTPPFFSFSLSTERLLERSIEIELAGARVRVPAAEDLLLLLCVHGTKECWGQLELTSALAELVRSCTELDWSQVASLARQTRSERMLWLGLCLAHDLLDLPVPDEISAQMAADTQTQRLAAEVRGRLFADEDYSPSVIGSTLFRLRARERYADRLRYCLRRAVTPTYQDCGIIALPPSLSALYYVLRPVRLGKNFGSSIFRRVL